MKLADRERARPCEKSSGKGGIRKAADSEKRLWNRMTVEGAD